MSLRDMLDVPEDSGTDVSPEEVSDEEAALFLEMRKRMERGSRVEFWEGPDGELVAAESVLHRASDYKSGG